MYGLEETTDLRFLEKLEVTQVCLGLFQVQLHLGGRVNLSIEGRFVQEIPETSLTVSHERGSPLAGNQLDRLLGQCVEEVRVISGGTIALTFSNLDRLLIFDDSKQFESYQIHSEAGVLVV